MFDKIKAWFSGGTSKDDTPSEKETCPVCGMPASDGHTHDEMQSSDGETQEASDMSDDSQESGVDMSMNSSDEKYCEKCGKNVPADHSHEG